MSILGQHVRRVEDPRLLTVGGTYVDDLDLPDAAHIVYVRSPLAHGRILGIDTAAAVAAPGVLAVLTAADVDMAPQEPEGGTHEAMARPLLPADTVRFTGEAVAMVVARTRAEAVDAAELVMVDYDPLPAVVDVEGAAAGGPPVHEGAGTNVGRDVHMGDDDAVDRCDVVVEQRIVNQRVAAAAMETRAVAARWDGSRLTVWIATQGVHSVRDSLAPALGLPAEAIRVIAPDVGGGFGAKAGLLPEEMLVPWAARRLGITVRWTETRNESLLAGGHARAQVQNVRIGGTRDGRIEAYSLDILQDVGAYPREAAILPWLTGMMAPGVYDIASVSVRYRPITTTTAPVVAYRGAGRPEATAALERAVDLFAREVGMDPAEVRRRNVVAPDAFPFTTRTGARYDSGDYATGLDRLLEATGYTELRAEQARRRERGDRVVLGIGLSTYVEITSLGRSEEFAAVEVRPDGRALLRVGGSPQGQGHTTTWAMLVQDRLGIPVENVDVVSGDTDAVPSGNLTGGSRSVQVVGSTVDLAAGRLLERARELAAETLEADAGDLVLDRERGVFHVAGVPTITLSWAELAQRTAGAGGLAVEERFTPEGATFPFGAHCAVVDVDLDTGAVRLRRYVALDDAGRIVNPLLAGGQRHGGIAQGVAQALLEEVRYDADGNLLTSTFADYEVISAAELPDLELLSMETPTPLNALGAKGIGEAGTIGATPALQNAVVDALAHLGVRHVDMPCTPQRVWDAVRAAEKTPA